MEMVELTFKYTQDEYIKAERQYLFASKTITKTSVVILAIYFLLSLVYFFQSSFGVLSIICIGIALFALITGCILYFYMPVYKFKKTSKYHEEYNLTFSKDGIKFKTSTINSKLSWNIYSEIWESEDFYFLIQAKQIYTIVPQRAFLNLATKQTFEKMVLSNLKYTKRML